MKKVLKVLGYTLGSLLLIVLLFAAYIQFAPLPVYEVKAPDLHIQPDSVRIAEGGRIVMTMCAECHRGDDGQLSGKLWADDAIFGKLWSANLSQHPEAGIGKYTDGELAYMIRTGVKRDGHFAGPFMAHPLMADEDVAAIIAFLRSDAPAVQPIDQRPPAPEYYFVGKLAYKLIFKPLPYPAGPIHPPPASDQIAWGKYLATSKWQCYRCHSASFETNDDLVPEKSTGFFAGGNPLADPDKVIVPSANLTPDPETGIGNWTQAQFMEAIRSRKRPDGTSVRLPMPPLTALSDAELMAIWAYLRTIPAVKSPARAPS